MSIRENIMAADGQWLMGRVMPRELLQGIGKYLHRVAPEREDALDRRFIGEQGSG